MTVQLVSHTPAGEVRSFWLLTSCVDDLECVRRGSTVFPLGGCQDTGVKIGTYATSVVRKFSCAADS
ncbi:hypothetical protein COCON_G00074960 [Conger conger]|uniref:Uncharacterized protein n=1 Tax=Conger conger TaxID=82655 RepID=A0A9Q1DNL9_CONCO|nr:hypothetical protein COCON_G00074960 [Conger conger]